MGEQQVMLYLDDIQKHAVRMIAASSSVYIRSDYIGISEDALKVATGARNTEEIAYFLSTANYVLAGETIPAKIIYDDILKKYVYLQMLPAEVLVDRINNKSLLLFLLIYYQRRVLNYPDTKMVDILDVIGAGATEKPRQRVEDAMTVLVKYGLVRHNKDADSFELTRIGEEYMTPSLQRAMVAGTMGENYDMDIVLEFFRNAVRSSSLSGCRGEVYVLPN
jgi:hypothetical protein